MQPIVPEPRDARGPSRRALLTGAAGLAGLGLLTLTGCSSGASAGTPTIPEAAATGVARRGGRLRIARPAASAAETLDSASSLSAYEYLGALYNRLVKLDQQGTPVPDLAEEWSANADGTEWTFRSAGACASTTARGSPPTTPIASIRHILDEKTGSPQAGVLGEVMDADSMRAVDPYTLRFALTKPNAEFPSLLTAYQCYIVPAGAIADIGRTGIGTGPFRLSSFTPAGAGSVEAFDGPLRRPPGARRHRLLLDPGHHRAGERPARRADRPDLADEPGLRDRPGRSSASDRATVARSKNAQWYTIPMLATSDEFSDPRVRQAMKLAYDPRQIVDTALQGTGSAGWDNPVPPQLAAFVDDHREYDPDKARALLKQAGRAGFRAAIYTSSYESVFTPMAVAYRDAGRRRGHPT